jgi:hypothetical protein
VAGGANFYAGTSGNWGSARSSKARATAFHRARPRDPLEVVTLYYDMEPNVMAMSQRGGNYDLRRARFTSPRGNIEYGVTRGGKRFRKAAPVGERMFVIGDPGDPLGIYIRNRTNSRVEAVVSLDGLDVVDGQPAGFSKRGYILDPGEKLFIRGWRTSYDSVVGMKFSDLRSPRMSAGGNAGVIGIAIFHEVGAPVISESP